MASLPSSTQSDGSEFVEGRLLDGFLLLAAGGSSSPEDVVSVNLSSLQIVDVATEDLAFFGNLDSLDISDNQLSEEGVLEQFGRLPRLCRLLLSCNSISALQVPANSLRLLEHLDLSFNELHGDVLSQLAHLPRLVTLNLASNCISSLPPEEELFDFRCLEELILDSNDLVQFVQWRALAVIPHLRKLSLASNRVKRLKDDAAEQDHDNTCFEALEELDLSQNEIAQVEDLPAVMLFRSLQKLTLSDNPCSKTALNSEHTTQGLKLFAQDTKAWYLCGSGCFKKRDKPTEPKLKMDRRRMRKVRSSMTAAKTKARAMDSQLGFLDEDNNQLLVDLRGGYPTTKTGAGDAGTIARSLDIASPPPSQDPLPVDDDLSEEELAQIFAAQTAKIANAFNQPVEEPASFRRIPPFTVSASAGQKLAQQGASGRQDDDAGIVPGSNRPSSTTFLTGVGEEGTGDQQSAVRSRGGGQREALSQRLESVSSLSQISPSMSPSPSHIGGSFAVMSPGQQPPAALVAAGFGSSVAGSAALAAVGTFEGGMLPPISGQPGSRGSSAGVSSSSPLDMLLKDTSSRTKQMPELGVREAMKALRAAAMSEYAAA
jgi:Leucine-rich repeat (LRR) protein